jgi:hypothetical protein
MNDVHTIFFALSDLLGIIIILIIALVLFCMIIGAIEMVINPQATSQAAQEYSSAEQKVNSAQHSIQVAVPGGNANKMIWTASTGSSNIRGQRIPLI